MEKKPTVGPANHLERIKAFIYRSIGEIPNDYLRFGDIKALFFLLTLLRDLAWHHMINELHPKTRLFYYYDRCCLCDWEPIGINLVELVDHLIDMGPHDQPSTPDIDNETPQPQRRKILRTPTL